MDLQGEPQWQAAGFGERRGARWACQLCPHECLLAEGETGRCQVRRHHGGRLETATLAAAVQHLDPIERKPFYHVQPGAQVLTVAAPGCSFSCRYCLNYRLSQFGRGGGLPWRARPLTAAELAAAAQASGGLLAFSYTEPSLAAELTQGLAALPVPPRLLWKSNGFLSAGAARVLAPLLTAVNIDLKAAAESPHRRLTGAGLVPIFDAVEIFLAAGVWVELSTPLIPGISDDDGCLRELARRIAGWDRQIPWHLLRFTPEYRMRAAPPTEPQRLAQAVALARAEGLAFVYVERALGPEGRTTFCPRCAASVLVRALDGQAHQGQANGRCPNCDLALPGRWSLNTFGGESDEEKP